MVEYIAEISSNFVTNGKRSKDRAMKLIEAAANSGATTVKFQLLKAELLYRNPDTVKAVEKAELPEEWIPELIACAEENGVEFLCSPFYLDAVDLLEHHNVERYKVASWELTKVGEVNPLLVKIRDTDKPVLLSTGGATFDEVEHAIEILRPGDETPDDIVLMHCNPAYPTDAENAELRRILDLATEFYPLSVGYSCHVADPIIAASSVMYQSEVIEVHFDLDDRKGNEAVHSLTPAKFAEMVRYGNMLQKAVTGKPNDFDVKFARKNYRRDPSDWLRGIK